MLNQKWIRIRSLRAAAVALGAASATQAAYAAPDVHYVKVRSIALSGAADGEEVGIGISGPAAKALFEAMPADRKRGAKEHLLVITEEGSGGKPQRGIEISCLDKGGEGFACELVIGKAVPLATYGKEPQEFKPAKALPADLKANRLYPLDAVGEKPAPRPFSRDMMLSVSGGGAELVSRFLTGGGSRLKVESATKLSDGKPMVLVVQCASNGSRCEFTRTLTGKPVAAEKPPAPSKPAQSAGRAAETNPKPEAPKPQAPKPQAPKPQAPKPQAPKPEAPKPQAPAPQPAGGAQPGEDRQKTVTAPGEETPAPDTKPAATKPAAAKPAGTKPSGRKAAKQKPAAKKLPAQKPAAQKPAGAPALQAPGSDDPAGAATEPGPADSRAADAGTATLSCAIDLGLHVYDVELKDEKGDFVYSRAAGIENADLKFSGLQVLGADAVELQAPADWNDEVTTGSWGYARKTLKFSVTLARSDLSKLKGDDGRYHVFAKLRVGAADVTSGVFGSPSSSAVRGKRIQPGAAGAELLGCVESGEPKADEARIELAGKHPAQEPRAAGGEGADRSGQAGQADPAGQAPGASGNDSTPANDSGAPTGKPGA